jgi:hypothetical protein
VPLTAAIKSGGVSSIFDPYAICRLVTGLRAPVRGLPKEVHPGARRPNARHGSVVSHPQGAYQVVCHSRLGCIHSELFSDLSEPVTGVSWIACLNALDHPNACSAMIFR